jgi:hypothetical protein
VDGKLEMIIPYFKILLHPGCLVFKRFVVRCQILSLIYVYIIVSSCYVRRKQVASFLEYEGRNISRLNKWMGKECGRKEGRR